MADPRFFKKNTPISLADLADKVGCVVGDADADFVVEDVSSLAEAGATDLSFLDNRKYKDAFVVSQAGACIVSESMATLAPEGMRVLVSQQPYKSYALAAQYFYPEILEPSISERACIHSTASIGEGCVIEAGVVIGENVEIGRGCRIGANAVISHSIIGDHVRVYPGACIGQDGLGFAIDPAGYVKVPQLGRVIVDDGVQIGANTTIDRGAGPDTVIGAGTWIDNLVQIGHNVRIGKGCIIVAQVGISGSTVIEDFVALGGQVGVAGHLTIEQGARIGAQSGVMRDVPAGREMMGAPAVPMRDFMKQTAVLKRLVKKGKE